MPNRRNVMPRKIIKNGPSILKIPTKGSYRQMIKSLPVAANSTDNPRYMTGTNPSDFLTQLGIEIGLMTNKSWMAPSGHAAAQNARPKNRANSKGRIKKSNAVKEIAYAGSKMERATF